MDLKARDERKPAVKVAAFGTVELPRSSFLYVRRQELFRTPGDDI